MEKEILIEELNAKGHGVAYLENNRVEVISAIPGDHALVELGRKRRSAFQASLKKIIAPSEDRVTPRCIHVPECGGCAWQQMNYPAQLKVKTDLIKKIYSPFALPIEPIIAAKEPWEYRNKMEFSFSQDKKGERYLGLILAGSRGYVFNLKECFLTTPWVSILLEAVRQWWLQSGLSAYCMPRDEGSLRTLMVREGKKTGHKMAMLTLSGNPQFAPTKKIISDFVTSVEKALPGETHLSIFLSIQQQIKGSPTQFFEMHLAGPPHIEEKLSILDKEFLFKISPTSFFQPNSQQAEVLYSTALQMIQGSFKKQIYDLYCGTGTLGMALASQAEKVIGIELNPHAIFDARMNALSNNIANIEFIIGDVAEKLADLPPSPDLIVVDPPRSGLLPQAIEQLLQCQPKEILYISCNPTTQVENIALLVDRGYHLIRVQPVDQFPHTIHIENIALLRRVKNSSS